jgi:hypothetical protein
MSYNVKILHIAHSVYTPYTRIFIIIRITTAIVSLNNSNQSSQWRDSVVSENYGLIF